MTLPHFLRLSPVFPVSGLSEVALNSASLDLPISSTEKHASLFSGELDLNGFSRPERIRAHVVMQSSTWQLISKFIRSILRRTNLALHTGSRRCDPKWLHG